MNISPKFFARILTSTGLLLILSACGGEAKEQDQTSNSTITTEAAAPLADCEFGGSAIYTGIDSNNNGTLESGERRSSSFDCQSAAELYLPIRGTTQWLYQRPNPEDSEETLDSMINASSQSSLQEISAVPLTFTVAGADEIFAPDLALTATQTLNIFERNQTIMIESLQLSNLQQAGSPLFNEVSPEIDFSPALNLYQTNWPIKALPTGLSNTDNFESFAASICAPNASIDANVLLCNTDIQVSGFDSGNTKADIAVWLLARCDGNQTNLDASTTALAAQSLDNCTSAAAAADNDLLRIILVARIYDFSDADVKLSYLAETYLEKGFGIRVLDTRLRVIWPQVYLQTMQAGLFLNGSD